MRTLRMRMLQERAKRYLPKIAAAMILAAIFAFANVALVQAAPTTNADPCPEGKTAAQCATDGLGQTAAVAGLGTTPRSISDIVGTLIYAALSLTGVVFVILMVYAGYLWMQARGNDDDVKKAKDIIINAMIGIIITALAFAITEFVLNRIAAGTTAS